jgi:hypothetical protein
VEKCLELLDEKVKKKDADSFLSAINDDNNIGTALNIKRPFYQCFLSDEEYLKLELNKRISRVINAHFEFYVSIQKLIAELVKDGVELKDVLTEIMGILESKRHKFVDEESHIFDKIENILNDHTGISNG